MSNLGKTAAKYVGPCAAVFIYPGENEMIALAEGVLRVLQGKDTAKTY